MFGGERRFDPALDSDREHRGGEDGVVLGFVELVDEVEVVKGLDLSVPESGLLGELSQRPAGDPLAIFDRTGYALPQAGQDAVGRTSDQEDLRFGATVAKDPAVDEVGTDRAQGYSRSNRSTGRTNTVAPPTSTSSG
jgi:hypothetical protein